jgi:hypothetical protein
MPNQVATRAMSVWQVFQRFPYVRSNRWILFVKEKEHTRALVALAATAAEMRLMDVDDFGQAFCTKRTSCETWFRYLGLDRVSARPGHPSVHSDQCRAGDSPRPTAGERPPEVSPLIRTL